MKTFITVLELIIGVIIAWMVLPKLIFGTELSHIFPGVRFSTNLALKHLLEVGGLALIYSVLYINHGPGYFGRRIGSFSAAVKVCILFTLVFSVYLHGYSGHTGDNIPSKLIPISLVEEGNLDLDEFRYGIFPGHYYSMMEIDRHYYSTYPIFTGITVTPFYAAVKYMSPGMFSLWKDEYSLRRGDLANGFVHLMQRFSAAIITSLAVAVFWLISNKLHVVPTIRVPLTAVFAFGTPMMSTAGTELWSHGPAILFMLLAIYFSAIDDKNKQSDLGLALGGLCSAWSIACRPTGLIAVSLLFCLLVFTHRRRSVLFLVSFCFLTGLIIYLNFGIYGTVFGGYQGQVSHFDWPSFERMGKILISPSRGVIPSVPLLLFLLFFVFQAVRRRPNLFTLAILAAAAELFIYSCWSVWWGGNCFGPRLLSEFIMWGLVALMAADVRLDMPVSRGKKALWIIALLLGIYSICLHVTGAVYGDKNWEREYFLKRGESALMDLKNSQITWTLFDVGAD